MKKKETHLEHIFQGLRENVFLLSIIKLMIKKNHSKGVVSWITVE